MWDDSFQPKPAYWAVRETLVVAAIELKPLESFSLT